jgi:hypothetical protein
MIAELREPSTVAKKEGIRVQIDEDVAKMARVASALPDKPMATFVCNILWPGPAEIEAKELNRRAPNGTT